MKNRITAAALCLLLMISAFSGCGRKTGGTDAFALQDSEKYYGGVFGDDEIISVNVEISEDDWKDLCENAVKEEYYSADITVNGVTLTNVGFRTKGFSSLTTVANSTSDRYGFKVKTNKYVKGQTLNGLDMFVLNGSFSDASYMREYLTYAAGEYLGTITPFLSYASLSINGELFGFYLMIEAYDDSFVERNTDDEDAVLYKASEENCTLLPTDTCAGYDVKVGKDDGLDNIKRLIEVLNGTTSENRAELEAILDVDSCLKAWAINTVLGNYDSYSGSKAHNYYLLYENGKFSYIGWDYNMSVGGFSDDNGASVTADVTTGVYNANQEQRPLISKLLAIDEYYEKYLGYVDKLCEYFDDIESITAQISERISEYVKNDPSAFYTYEQYEKSISKTDSDLSAGNGRPDGGAGQQFQGGNGGFPQGPGGNGGMQPPDGFDPNSTPDPNSGNGGMPQPPDGFDPSNTPDPSSGNGGMPQPPDGNRPDMPDGTFSPGSGFPGGSLPDMPDGTFSPDGPGGAFSPGQGGMPGMPGGSGMMTNEGCSIVDYILQRIANIRAQLGK